VILNRRASTTAAGGEVADDEPEVEVAAAETSKGRATPKRADARKSRRGAPPKDPKQAKDQRRTKAREQRELTRQALRTGDEKHLPMRDAGPERRLARDVVDSRATAGQYLFLLIVAALVLSLFPSAIVKVSAEVVALVAVVVMTIDSVLCGRRARDAVAAKYGKKASTGISTYAAMRAFLPRRFRKPPPRVERGAAIT
jgi:Protein of unknown function (DUF3043)